MEAAFVAALLGAFAAYLYLIYTTIRYAMGGMT